MKVLYLILLVPLCHGLLQCPTPKDMRVTTNGDGDNLWLDINWSKVENTDDEDPILGYKVKMWLVKPEITYKYETNAEGQMEANQQEELPHLDVNEEPTKIFTEITVPVNKTEATIKALKKGITYEVGVHAYTAKCKESVTKKMRLRLDPSN